MSAATPGALDGVVEEQQQQPEPGLDGTTPAVNDVSRAYAALFMGSHPKPNQPMSEALAKARARCDAVSSTPEVGGPSVEVGHSAEHALHSLDGQQAAFAVRVYLPTTAATQEAKKLGIILYAHGGGMVVGSLTSYDSICRRLAQAAGAAVVSVGYRLAPEHPYPAGLDDCEAAYRWAIGPLASELHPDTLDPERVALMGDSAGGHFCSALAVRLRRKGDLPPQLRPKAAVLIYPALDLTMTTPSIARYGRCSHLTPEAMDAMVHAYLAPGGDPDTVMARAMRTELLTDPEVSALFVAEDDLAATFPPTLLLSAECDPIADDAARFEVKLDAAGVKVRRVVYPRIIHGFWSGWGMFPEAAAAQAEACAWLRECGVIGVED